MLSVTAIFPPGPSVGHAEHVGLFTPVVSLQDMLRARLPTMIVTPVILAAIGALFVLMAATSGEVSFSSDTLVRWGAQFEPRIANGEWWRLLTAMWLHADPVHLGLNALFLWRFGNYVERLLGPVVFLIVYLLSGVGASVVSLQFTALSVGASGALFGLVGVLLTIAITSGGRGALGDMLTELRPNLVSVVVANGILGALIPGVDNAAHLGGLGWGLGLGWLVGRHSLEAVPPLRVTLIPIVMTVAIASAGVFAIAGRPDARPEIVRLGPRIDEAEEAFRTARADLAAGRRSAAAVAADAQQTLLPLIHEGRERAAGIVRAMSARRFAGPGDRGRLGLATAWDACLARYEDAWRLRIAGLRDGDAGRIADGDARAAAALHDLSRTLAGR